MMMRNRRFFALLLAAGMAAAASGCENLRVDEVMSELVAADPQAGVQPQQSNAQGSTAEVDPEQAEAYVEDAASIYRTLNYKTEMLAGKYALAEADGASLPEEKVQAILAEQELVECPGQSEKVTALPYRIEAGVHSNITPLNYLDGYSWMQLYLLTESGEKVAQQAAYSVRGNKLTLHLVDSFEYNSTDESLTYALSDTTWVYEFGFEGNTLTLSDGGKSVTLIPDDMKDGATPEVADANLAEGSAAFCGIEAINLTADAQNVTVGGEQYPVDAYEFAEDGCLRMIWNDADGKHSAQLVSFYLDDDGLILSDGNRIYNYSKRSYDLYEKEINANLRLSDAQRENLSAEELEALVAEVDELYADISAALQDAGVDAVVDPETGEVALGSGVLFDVDQSAVSDAGKDVLRKFLQVYTSVVLSEKYTGFVSEIEIQGHTDPTGTPEHNLALSQDRATRVKEFCFSPENGLTPEYTAKLASMLTSNGYAAEHPVFDENGEVDLDACRRVSFKFVVDVG